MFKNEDKVYPRSEGHKGRFYLFDAISELCNGKTKEDVLAMFGDKHRGL